VAAARDLEQALELPVQGLLEITRLLQHLARGVALQAQPQAVEFIQFLERGTAHRKAAVGLRNQQTALLQKPGGLAYRCAADAHVTCDSSVSQALTRANAPGDDRARQLFSDILRQIALFDRLEAHGGTSLPDTRRSG